MNARDTLIAFMSDMNEWENKYRTAFMADHSVNKEPYLQELNEIFEKWCTTKERKNGRQTSMKVSFPPDYDPVGDEVTDEAVMKNKAYFIVQKHTGLENKYRYTLHYKNNEWRVDKKEWFDDVKWKQAYL